jgi:hypothetical protein
MKGVHKALCAGAAIFFFLLAVVLRICFHPAAPPVEHTYRDLGTLVDIQPVRRDVGWIPARIVTTKGVYYIAELTSGERGAAVTLRDDGYLFIEGTYYGYKAWGFK